MSKFLRLFLATLTASIFVASVAKADMNGFTIGVIHSSSDFTTVGTEHDPGTPLETNTDSKMHNADYGSIFAEFSGVDDNGLSFAFGVEITPGEASLGSKARTDTDAGDSADGDDDGTYTAKAQVENMWGVYAEPGYVFNDIFGLYAKGGVTSMDIISLEGIAVGTDSSTYGNEQVWGAMYGFGVKAALPMGLVIKIEATEHVYEDISLQSATGNLNKITADVDSSDIRLAIGYNF